MCFVLRFVGKCFASTFRLLSCLRRLKFIIWFTLTRTTWVGSWTHPWRKIRFPPILVTVVWRRHVHTALRIDRNSSNFRLSKQKEHANCFNYHNISDEEAINFRVFPERVITFTLTNQLFITRKNVSEMQQSEWILRKIHEMTDISLNYLYWETNIKNTLKLVTNY